MVAQPGYMEAFDSLFGDAGYAAYLQGGTPGASSQTTTQASAAGGADLNTLEGMAEYAKQAGWADPGAFNADMLVDPNAKAATRHSEGGDWSNPSYTQFKDEFAAARGMSGDYASGNQVEVKYGGGPKTQVEGTGTFWDNPAVYQDSIPADQKSGYRLKGGQVDGTKYPTAMYYNYDADGKYTGYDLQEKTPWYVDAAPLIQMGLMATGIGGGFAGLGASANSAMGLGLGTTGQAALGGALVGGGTAALTGQNVLKGAAIGATGAGISAANPGGMMGITNPAVRSAINGSLSSAGRAVVAGTPVDEAMVGGAINGAARGLTRKA